MRRAEYGAQTQSACPDAYSSGDRYDYHTEGRTGDSSYPFQINMLLEDFDYFHYTKWLYQDWGGKTEG